MQRDYLWQQLPPAPTSISERLSFPHMDPNHFPSRLHEMLCDIDMNGRGEERIVSWQPHGPDQGAYYHPDFARDTPEKVTTIHHTNIRGKRGRKPKSKLTEPDFYAAEAKIASPELSSQEAGKQSSAPAPMGSLWFEQVTPKASSKVATLANVEAQERPRSPLDGKLRTGASLFSGEANSIPSLRPSGQPLFSGGLHHDSLAAATGASIQSQLSGGILQQQQPLQPLPAPSLRRGLSGTGATDDVHGPPAPPPALARQSSDFSIGAFSLFGGLAESSPEEPTLERRDSSGLGGSSRPFASPQPSSLAATLPVQLPYSEHRERLNDLLQRNQQQQRSLQMQQQQLEQQRLELQLREQQQLDVAGSSSGSRSLPLEEIV
ncbi:expressed unknown protein [Seminavis robusta]|uniref:Uncharacterized protein n=1 Tax=Seminavis robusta TaxID=568900 RepID=A0A9N8EMY8_9STRA|nr:expressed unknown protein [Seminavis robusta]|eukprot:Sro1250_g256090.1 n/a (377) ;mRNA; f:29045-30628